MTATETTPLSDLLVPVIGERTQNAIGMDWLDRWTKAGGTTLSPSTVESRLSEMLKERIAGVRFFFNDGQRESILFDVLGLDDQMREAA